MRSVVVVPAQDVVPRLVADRPDQIGRADDVGEHERPDHPPARGVLVSCADQLVASVRLASRTQARERLLRHLQLQDRGRLVPGQAVGERERSARLRGLERRVRLGPRAQSLAELDDRGGCVVLVGQRGAVVWCDIACSTGESRLDAIAPSSSAAARASVTSCATRAISALRGEQPGAIERVGGIGQGGRDRRSSRLGPASREVHEREAGVRLVAELMRRPERLLGAIQVAEPQPDLADLVGPGTGLRQPSERRQFGLRLAGLVLGLGELARAGA